ncbi:MAG: L,D-transpeptidase family protein [Actinomycetota bacterium]|nr:L,D-transpeptidase family protein [Actinomycetota bacterium]
MWRTILAAACMAVVFTLALPGTAGAGEVTLPGGMTSPGGTLPPPTGVREVERPEDAGLRIAITWDAVPGASGYRVYRSDPAHGEFVPVGGKAADSMLAYPLFLDGDVEQGRVYHYAVAAVDDAFREGPLSERVAAGLEPAARGADGPKRIVCSLPDQRLYFYEGDQLINVTRCSTGLRNSTPAGNFRILGHYGTHAGLGGAICDYWMAFTPSHGMHSWPRGSSGYEAGLGAPASHGCIRQHPLEAYWPYHWAPDGTPLTITYASLAKRVISGCHATAGVPEPAGRWYFAEGYTAEGYDTYLLLSNPGEEGAVARVRFFKDSGEVVEQACGIAPHSRFTLSVDDVPGMDAAAFSIQVDADRPLVAERAMYFAAGPRTDGTVTAGSTETCADWYFAEGYTAGGFDTWLLLANPGDRGVSARVYFLLEGGGRVDQFFWVGPHSRYTVPVDALPAMGEASFSMQVHADGPVVAERAMYFTKDHIKGGHVTMGAPRLSQEWYFAEGCTRRFYQSYILLGNPGEEDALVTIDYYLNHGSIRHQYLVRARSRVTVPISSQGGLGDEEMAFSVFSDRPLVAERSLYYDLDSHRGGDVAMGSPRASTTWYFAEGYTDGAFDTYLLLSNPSFSPADVRVEFLRDDGAVFEQRYLVPAQRRVTLTADVLPGLERAAFSTRIGSDVPIMAERAMYFVMPRGY